METAPPEPDAEADDPAEDDPADEAPADPEPFPPVGPPLEEIVGIWMPSAGNGVRRTPVMSVPKNDAYEYFTTVSGAALSGYFPPSFTANIRLGRILDEN